MKNTIDDCRSACCAKNFSQALTEESPAISGSRYRGSLIDIVSFLPDAPLALVRSLGQSMWNVCSEGPVTDPTGTALGVSSKVPELLLENAAGDECKVGPRAFRPSRHRMSVRACQFDGGMMDSGTERLRSSKIWEITSTPCSYTASTHSTRSCFRMW